MILRFAWKEDRTMKKEFVCIVCPRGCHLVVDENMEVTGNACPRGKNYALSELTNPVRMITSSVRVSNRVDTLVSVKTSAPIPKAKIMDVMDIINGLSVEAPTHINQIIKENILDLGIDILITKNIN